MLCQSLLEPSQQDLRSVHPTPLCSQEAVVYVGEVTLPKPHDQEMLRPLSSSDPRPEIVRQMLISHLLRPRGALGSLDHWVWISPAAYQVLQWFRLNLVSFEKHRLGLLSHRPRPTHQAVCSSPALPPFLFPPPPLPTSTLAVPFARNKPLSLPHLAL